MDVRRRPWRPSPPPARSSAFPSTSGSPTRGANPRTWRSSSPPWRARRKPPWCGSTAIGGSSAGEPRHRARCRPGALRARQRRRVRRAGHPGARRPRAGRGARPRRHRLPHPRPCDRRRGPVLLGLSALPAAARRRELRHDDLVGAGHAIRRADFEEAGGYDDALFIAGASWTARGARCSPPFLLSNPSPPLHADPRRTPTKAGRRSPGLRRARSGARPAGGCGAPAMERIATLLSVLPFHAASSAVACARPSGRRQKPRRTACRRRA